MSISQMLQQFSFDIFAHAARNTNCHAVNCPKRCLKMVRSLKNICFKRSSGINSLRGFSEVCSLLRHTGLLLISSSFHVKELFNEALFNVTLQTGFQANFFPPWMEIHSSEITKINIKMCWSSVVLTND